MYSIGVDLGGTKIAVGLVDENNKILFKESLPTLAYRPAEEITKDIASLCRKVAQKGGVTVEEVDAIGLAIPGTINVETGIVQYSNNIKFSDFHVVDFMVKELNLPRSKFKIGNDANLAAYGEAVAGTGKGASMCIVITLGTGVGSGIIIDDKILTGIKYGGAEIGHMVIEYNGRQCTCGRKGCFEAYCSATALVDLTRTKFKNNPKSLMRDFCDGDINKIGGKTAFQAMYKGDKAAKEVVDTYMSYLACGIANVINIFQPDVICIGGGISNEGPKIIEMLVPLVKEQLYSKDEELVTSIKLATLANEAGIIGAAAYARHEK